MTFQRGLDGQADLQAGEFAPGAPDLHCLALVRRARLRGAFIKRAKERKRDYTVDWVHLKLNDQAQRTVLCKDPFKARDERVERLIASL